MLTLFHAPNSRSSRIVTLIDEMGIKDQVHIIPIDILRQDGSGAADPRNPHPDAKAPALLHDGGLITESAAVILYLTDMFPNGAMAPIQADAKRADYLTWLFYYGGVVEPVLIFEAMGIKNPALTRTFRDHAEIAARLHAALAKGPWLLGDSYSAADLLMHSPYAWFRDATPNDPLIKDWVARCMARPAQARTMATDAVLMDQLAA